MKKNIMLLMILGFSCIANANSSESENFINDDIFGKCKHNAMHYASSVRDLNYAKDMLDSRKFTLKELNKQCQTVFNIAIELGDIDLLKMFGEYLGSFDVENGEGENLIEFALKEKQPEVLLYLIKNGVDPYKVSSNGKSAIDYQKEYGNDLTSEILLEYQKRNNELDSLRSKIKVLEDELAQKTINSELLASKNNEITTLKAELDKKISENYDSSLEKNAKDSKKVNVGQLKTYIPDGEISSTLVEGKANVNSGVIVNSVVSSNDIKEETNLIDIYNDGTKAKEDSILLFDVLSKPLFEKQ